MHDYGRCFAKKRPDVACHWLKEAAAKGHADAIYELGIRHLFGQAGARKSYSQARRLLSAAARQEHAEAMYYLGFMELHALGCRHDCRSAYAWFCRAAELNSQNAQSTLGFMYAHGIGCEADMELARHWYEVAATRGGFGAQFALACLFLSLEQNKSAFVWASIAADNGVTGAQALLCRLYMNGLGTSRDITRALMWCLIVQSTDDVDLDSLETVLKCQSSMLAFAEKEQFEKAKILAFDWLERRLEYEALERLYAICKQK